MDELPITLNDVEKGYYAPELSKPNDARVNLAVKEIRNPAYVLAGIKNFQKEQSAELVDDKTISHQTERLVNEHGRPVLAQMKKSLEKAQSEIDAIQDKRAALYERGDLVQEARFGSIRDEFSKLENSEQYRRVTDAVLNQETEVLAALATMPQMDSVIGKLNHQKAKSAYEQASMGDELLVLNDLHESASRLGMAIFSFEHDLEALSPSPNTGADRFNEAMKAQFVPASA